jgi:hypothetical protein
MIQIDNSKVIESSTFKQGPQYSGLGLADRFAVAMADELLRTTWQYAKWNEIRQNNEPKAFEIAKLVLERHAYVAGKAPTTIHGRKRFDQITEILAKEGIYLYRSHEFKKPIFPAMHTEKSEEIVRAQVPLKTHTVPISPLTLALRQRFANKDCLEFLAGVLEDNGIDYYGQSGVASVLIDKARNQGQSLNSYLTGEGVTNLLCESPLTIHIPKVTGASHTEIWDKIEPHLRKGAILSYSSQHFGHTGIVDRTRDGWIYINASGTGSDRNSYRVLEEDLKSEITNWLRRAREKNTFLDVTIGSVDRGVASAYTMANAMLSSSRASTINLLS